MFGNDARRTYPAGVTGWRMLAGVVLSGIALAATATSLTAAAPLYNIAASEACLKTLPGAVAGLPPASPPIPPALFVYRYPPSHFMAPMVGALGAWYGSRRTSAYSGVSISFFKNARDARRFKARDKLYAEIIFRNVAVAWDGPAGAWRSAVEGCLLAVGGKLPSARSVPKASLATFAGYWGGHTRGLRISSAGRAREYADDGCCTREYDMTLQILSVTGTLTRASASYRVMSFRRHFGPRVHVGQIGRLVLRDGIVTSSLTGDYFCSDPAWGATGSCGA